VSVLVDSLANATMKAALNVECEKIAKIIDDLKLNREKAEEALKLLTAEEKRSIISTDFT
jgi:hypothetical protein